MLTFALVALSAMQAGIIIRLCRDAHLDMWNHHGGRLIILALSLPMRLIGGYTLVFADVNRLKQLNSATGNHFATNRMLYAGLRVRLGEFAWRIWGDEFAFLIRGDGQAFCGRIARQLASQPLTREQRAAIAAVEGVELEQVVMSATFAVYPDVRNPLAALERASADVLAKKAARDAALQEV